MTALTPTAPALYTDHTTEHLLRFDATERERAECDVTASAVVAILAKSTVSELRRLHVKENDQSIYLSGRVRSFYHKQLAQEAIRPVTAGRKVINRVDVCDLS